MFANKNSIFNFIATLNVSAVIKVRSKKLSVNVEAGIRELTGNPKRKTIFKKGPLQERDLRRLRFTISGKGCNCPLLKGDASWVKRRLPRAAKKDKKRRKGKKGKKGRKRKRYTYLIMGRKVGQRLLVTEVYKWSKKNQPLRKAAANKFNQQACPSFGPMMHGRY